MTVPAEFAMKAADGTWTPCAPELNVWLDRVTAAFGGLPNTVLAFDDHGEAHILAGGAANALYLALLALDARLRPERGYRKKADEIYAQLAGLAHADGIQELRQVFRLGAQRPWLENGP